MSTSTSTIRVATQLQQGIPLNNSQGRISEPARIHYLDNLRGVAMLLGVLLHAGFAYALPSQSVWIATDPGSSVTIDALIWLIHLFRMSLFFLLSGYFAKLVVQRKGVKHFLLNRVYRILLPFAVFYPLLLAAMAATIVFSLSYLASPLGLMGWIAAASTQAAGAGATDVVGEQTPGTMHLWFLYYLIFFSVLAAVCSQLSWIQFDWLFARPTLMFMMPLALLPGILGAGVPIAAPESFVPTWWPFLFYGLFYWSGWQLWGREFLLDRLNRIVYPLLGVSGLLFLVYYATMPALDLDELIHKTSSTYEWSDFVAAFLTSYLSVMLTLAALLLGREFLGHPAPFLRLMADASYWVYLIHLPIVIFLQTLLIPLAWPVFIKLGITIAGTMIACLSTYLVFVRYTPLGWILHGKRSFP